MKNKLFLILAAAAAFAVIGCAPELELTGPDLGNFNDAKSPEYDGASSYTYAEFVTVSAPSGLTANSISDTAGIVTIDLSGDGPDNDAYLDITRKTGSEFENAVLDTFKFYRFSNAGVMTATPATEQEVPASFWKREGNTAYIRLNMSAVDSDTIVVRAPTAKLTYNDGNKFDADGNKKPGEEFYDDFFDDLTVNGGSPSITVVQIKRVNPVSFTPGVSFTLTGTTWRFTLTYDDFAYDSSDYSAFFQSVKAEKLNRDSARWENYDNVSRSRSGSVYTLNINGVANTDVFRVVITDRWEFTTAVDLYGAKQRLSGANVRQKKEVLLGPSVVNNVNGVSYTTTQRISSNSPFTTVTATPSLPNSKGVVLSFKFNPSVVGDLGLNTIDDNFYKSFKIGNGNSPSAPNLAFIPIEKAELVYDSTYTAGFVAGVPNRLNVYLDPAYKQVNNKYLWIAPGYGYNGNASGISIPAGKFGDVSNYENVIDGQGSWEVYSSLSSF